MSAIIRPEKTPQVLDTPTKWVIAGLFLAVGVLIILLGFAAQSSAFYEQRTSEGLPESVTEPRPFGPGWAADYGINSEVSDSFCLQNGKCWSRKPQR